MGNGKYQKDIWITPKTYSYLFSQFSPQANQQWVNTADERVLHISGEIGQDDSIRIDPWYSFMSTPETSVTGTYTINAVDSLGQIVATQGFDISFEILSNSPVETEYALFSTVINFPQNTTAFRIMHDDTVLLAVPVSVNIPSIQVLSPNGGESWPISGDQVVSWEANDLDGDILFYSAEYTPDGINWTVLAADITSTQITVNTAFLAGGNAARVKIVATDGVNTSVDESDGTFMVGKKNPQIFIISPSDNFSIQPGLSFSLQAYGYDLEDGEFDDAAYHWTSDRDGDLGNGFLRHVSLSPGKHNITLTVTDKDGNQATASVTIFIGYQQYLPFAIKQ
jgi:hypothetical protein